MKTGVYLIFFNNNEYGLLRISLTQETIFLFQFKCSKQSLDFFTSNKSLSLKVLLFAVIFTSVMASF